MKLEDELQLEMEIEMFADDVSGWTVARPLFSDAFAINGRQIDAV